MDAQTATAEYGVAPEKYEGRHRLVVPAQRVDEPGVPLGNVDDAQRGRGLTGARGEHAAEVAAS